MAERSSFNDCGELGIKRGLTRRVFYELVRPPMTASPSGPLSPAQSLLPKISSTKLGWSWMPGRIVRFSDDNKSFNDSH